MTQSQGVPKRSREMMGMVTGDKWQIEGGAHTWSLEVQGGFKVAD